MRDCEPWYVQDSYVVRGQWLGMEHRELVIVGAGVSGINTACYLENDRYSHNYLILEGRGQLGGTWDLFRYPGVRSDSDMYTYAFSCKPWVSPQLIASGESILQYLNDTVDEYSIRPKIRFGHRVQRVSWSTADNCWLIEGVKGAGEPFKLTANFLHMGTGYYSYEQPHVPEWPGYAEYQGVVANPQSWPKDLDYTDKRVLVIGSGATAVTIVPSMAESAAKVTMLQRSPAYIACVPGESPVEHWVKRGLPARIGHSLLRALYVSKSQVIYWGAKWFPSLVRWGIRRQAINHLGSQYPVDTHFRPTYAPWDQRLCISRDADLYEAIKSKQAEVVTDTIRCFTKTGVELQSGQKIEADIVVPATGLKLEYLGKIKMVVDGKTIAANNLVVYKGIMAGGIPNWTFSIGYTQMSWTLRTELTGQYLVRLLRHMRKRQLSKVFPLLSPEPKDLKPAFFSMLSSGYVQRGANSLPKQGKTWPWVNTDNYIKDYLAMKWGALNDGVLQFKSKHRPSLAHPPWVNRRPRYVFEDRTILITGAGSGIGRELAIQSAKKGSHLALVDISESRLLELAQVLDDYSIRVSTHVIDLGETSWINTLLPDILKSHPHVDILVNNAGVALAGLFEDLSSEEFNWLQKINLDGVVNLTRLMLPHLKQQPDAQIVNISSVFGIVAPFGQSAYSMSKFAVRGFSEALRHELAESSVGVSVVHPGGVKTNIVRDARAAQADERSDLEIQQEKIEVEKAFGTRASEAAQVIIRGIERRKPRILVGLDAYLMVALERLFPVSNIQIGTRLLRWSQQVAAPAVQTVLSAPRLLLTRALLLHGPDWWWQWMFKRHPLEVDGRKVDARSLGYLRMHAKLTASKSTWHLHVFRRAYDTAGVLFDGKKQKIAKVQDISLELPEHRLAACLYVPDSKDTSGPALLYFHGGGFVIGSLESHDRLCRKLALSSGMKVLAVAYRLGPEHKLSASLNDARLSWDWLIENAEGLGIDIDRLVVAGDSAGAFLAIYLMHSLIEDKVAIWPKGLGLIYPPFAEKDNPTHSRTILAEQPVMLTKRLLDWFEAHAHHDGPDTLRQILHAKGFPSTWILTAGLDPLRDEGKELAHCLEAAGVHVEYQEIPDAFHGFVTMSLVYRRADEIITSLGKKMRQWVEMSPSQDMTKRSEDEANIPSESSISMLEVTRFDPKANRAGSLERKSISGGES